jgi:hypothetical protein
MQVGRYSKLVRPPNSFEDINKASWVQYMDTVYTQIVCPLAHVQRSSIFGAATGVVTAIPFNQRIVDTHDWWSLTAPYQYKPLVAGYYHAHVSLALSTTAWATAGILHYLYIRKNGTVVYTDYKSQGADFQALPVLKTTGTVWLNGKSDVLDFAYLQSTGGTVNMIASNPALNYANIFRVSP